MSTDATTKAETLLEWLKQLLEESGFPEQWTHLEQCPACGNGEIHPAFEKWKCPHSCCSGCNHIFVNPQPNDRVLNEIYQTGYTRAFRDFVEIPLLHKHPTKPPPYSLSEEMIAAIVDEAMRERPCQSWLDVGGGFGWFSKTLRDHHGIPRTGINEIDIEAAKFARMHFGIENFTEPDETKWRIVSSIATLEHVPDPVSFIQKMASFCEEDGTIIISVPNFTRLNRLVAKASSPIAAPPFHLSLFNVDSLAIAAERSGVLKDIKIQEMGGPAFNAIDAVDHIGHFDISIPTESNPEARSIFSPDYDEPTQVLVNCLAVLGPRLRDLFIEIDGRSIATLFARRA